MASTSDSAITLLGAKPIGRRPAEEPADAAGEKIDGDGRARLG